MRTEPIHVIGGGLAGSEAAWQIATRGLRVILHEMRPAVATPAHQTDQLAELVCSNSLGSDLVDRAPGLLKEELRRLGSLIVSCADATRVPAGGALAVGREAFAALVTERISSHPAIELRRDEVTQLPADAIVVVATGPLTSPALAKEIGQLAGSDYLYFYDAMAPIVTLDSIDMERAFRSSRYDRGEADYINCPLDRDEYDRFVAELVAAETIVLRSFEEEDQHFFEACLPVEVMARRGHKVLAFGPMKPVGLTDPLTGRRPYAVVQLRQDNLAGTLYNLVGFQTNLRWNEQARVFRLIPGLEKAEFVRFGQMHRNTYIDSPRLLDVSMRFSGSREPLLRRPDHRDRRLRGFYGQRFRGRSQCQPAGAWQVLDRVSSYHDDWGASAIRHIAGRGRFSANETQLRLDAGPRETSQRETQPRCGLRGQSIERSAGLVRPRLTFAPNSFIVIT